MLLFSNIPFFQLNYKLCNSSPWQLNQTVRQFQKGLVIYVDISNTVALLVRFLSRWGLGSTFFYVFLFVWVWCWWLWWWCVFKFCSFTIFCLFSVSSKDLVLLESNQQMMNWLSKRSNFFCQGHEVYWRILVDCLTFLSLFLDVTRIFYANNFPHTARLWNVLPIEYFPLTYDLNGFKSRINRHF